MRDDNVTATYFFGSDTIRFLIIWLNQTKSERSKFDKRVSAGLFGVAASSFDTCWNKYAYIRLHHHRKTREQEKSKKDKINNRMPREVKMHLILPWHIIKKNSYRHLIIMILATNDEILKIYIKHCFHY